MKLLEITCTGSFDYEVGFQCFDTYVDMYRHAKVQLDRRTGVTLNAPVAVMAGT